MENLNRIIGGLFGGRTTYDEEKVPPELQKPRERYWWLTYSEDVGVYVVKATRAELPRKIRKWERSKGFRTFYWSKRPVYGPFWRRPNNWRRIVSRRPDEIVQLGKEPSR